MAKSNKGKSSAKSTKPVRVTEVEVVTEEKGGMTWMDGVAIITMIALIAAILVADKGMAGYGAGKFF